MSAVAGITGLVTLAIVMVLINNFGYNATFFGNVGIRATLTAPAATITNLSSTSASIDDLSVSNSFQVPVDSTTSIAQGSLQYSTVTNSLQVYKTGDGWVDVGGGKIPIAETNTTLVGSVDTPVDLALLNASFNGTVRNVGSELAFNTELVSAADNDVINLVGNITFAGAPGSVTKRLKINLNGFTMFVPVQVTSAWLINVAAKDVYITGGTIRYVVGSAPGSSASLISCIGGSRVYFHDCVLRYGEFCISTGSNSFKTTLYVGDSQLIYEGNGILGQSGSNSFRTIGLQGMVTRDSYVYVTNCSIFSEGQGGSETQRVVFCYNQPTTSGSITVTACDINPAHRLQAVVFYEATTDNVRADHRLFIDSNNIGTAGLRNQLALIFQGTRQSLNSFDSAFFLENTVGRLDDDKGLFYIDTEFSTGAGGSQAKAGSTDVYIFNNTHPAIPAAGVTRKIISKDGFVRGFSGITSCYLQKISIL
jgi:hypothetical protein